MTSLQGAPGHAARAARLVVESDDGPAGSFELRGDDVVGRAAQCDIVLEDSAVSRRHARIESTPGGWLIHDLGSSRGTILDGSRISGPALLVNGARLRIGRLDLRFETGPPGQPPSPPPLRPAGRVRTDLEPTTAPRTGPQASRGAPPPGAPEALRSEPPPERAPLRFAEPELAPVGGAMSGAAAAPVDVPPSVVGAADPLVGRTLGDVAILRRIGVGATGHVYHGRQENLARDVAVKVLAPKYAASPEKIEAFLREARSAARLVHPSIVTVFDARRVEDTTFFLMELMDGGSLEQALAAAPHGRIPWKQAFPLFLASARGLEYLHAQGFLHRDLKPGNLLLKSDGTVKIADLGIALELREAATAARAGTPHYAAPEIVRGGPPTPASDLYSLGATFHHILTGRTPFEASDRKTLLRRVAEGHRPRVILHATDVPGWLAAIVDRLTSGDPADRLESASELVRALEETEVRRQARAMGISAAPPGVADRARGRRGPAGPIAAALALAAIGGVVWALSGRNGAEADVAPAGGKDAPSETLPPRPDATDPSDTASETPAAGTPGAGTPAGPVLRKGKAFLDAGRPLEAMDHVLSWARAPERRAARDAEADAAVAACLSWVREQSPARRADIEKEIAADQARISAAYGAGVRPDAAQTPREDLAAVLTAKARAESLEKLAPKLRAGPLRRRAEDLAARLGRVDVAWRRLVAGLGDDSIVKTWDEIKGISQVAEGSSAWISRASPPTVERISFERQAGTGRERVSVRWADLGIRQIADKLVLPYLTRLDAGFRTDLAEMFDEALCVAGAEGCLAGLPDSPRVVRIRAEVASLRSLLAAYEPAPLSAERATALRVWAERDRGTDAFLRLAPEAVASRVLLLDEAGLDGWLAVKDEAPAAAK